MSTAGRMGMRTTARVVAVLTLLALMCVVGTAYAQTRAWLDREQIALGETTTLNVETDAAMDTPDWAPLSRDFEVSGHTSRRQVELTGGRRSTRAFYGVALKPRREGVLAVPALQVGTARTQPLSISVAPAPAASARRGGPVFIEAEVDASAPYIQQSVGYVLRLFYATPLLSGSLDQPAPDGASLQRIGSDVQYNRDIGGRRYSVVERRYQIVPERSGTLTIPGARFEGRGASGGLFDDMFNRGPRELAATGTANVLEVRAMPAAAPQPWLPLHGVQARWLEAPTDGRAGAASTFVLEAVFDGAVGVQLPEIGLPPLQGAQVFAEPPQYDESFEDGRPRVRLTRRYSVVPRDAGTVQVPGPRIAWWDVNADAARASGPPAVSLAVAAGEAQPGISDAAGQADTVPLSVAPAPATGNSRFWPAIAAVFAALWLATAWLAWRFRQQRTDGGTRPLADAPATPARAASAGTSAQAHRRLMQALTTGEPVEVESALLGLPAAGARDLDTLVEQLESAPQRAAVQHWQRARWTGGDLPAARRILRDAFRGGVAWRTPPRADRAGPALPPLYPHR